MSELSEVLAGHVHHWQRTDPAGWMCDGCMTFVLEKAAR